MIYDVFYISLLKQNTIKKRRVNKLSKLLKSEKEFEARDNKEYEVKSIINSVVYSRKVNN